MGIYHTAGAGGGRQREKVFMDMGRERMKESEEVKSRAEEKNRKRERN